MDSGRTKVIERAEFSRYQLQIIDQDTTTIPDILLHAEQLQKGRKIDTTASETWKKFERNVSEFFNTVRNALSGSWTGVSNSDTIHPHFYIECKYRKEFEFSTTFKKMREAQPAGRVLTFVFTDFKVYPGDLWLFDKRDMERVIEAVSFVSNEQGEGRFIISSNKINLQRQKKHGGMLSLYRQTVERAALEGKIPIVAVKMKGHHHFYLGIDPKHLKMVNRYHIRN